MASLVDDPAKILALSTAAGLAAPFTEHFFTGISMAAPDQLSYDTASVMVAAGMRIGFDCWLVVSPVHSVAAVQAKVKLHLPFGSAKKVSACEIISGLAYTFAVGADGAVELELPLAGTAVLHLTVASGGAGLPALGAPCIPTQLWTPARAGATLAV